MYAEVILALPLDKTFYYEGEVLVNSYVKVPFGATSSLGLVVGISTSCSITNLKKIEEVLNIPQASDCFVGFIRWVARYNLIPLGKILKLALSRIKENEKYYSLNSVEAEELTLSQKKVKKLLETEPVLSEEEIRERGNVSRETLRKMLIKNIIALSPRPSLKEKKTTCSITLSEEQKKAYEVLIGYNRHQVFLLKGITGSGKTEVYLKVIAKALSESNNAQALVLLPEVILATQISERLSKYFKSAEIIQWHSSLSQKFRENNWWKIVTGRAQIIIGARSALFLPYKNLKIIVIDEEHDSSFKQESGSTNYHGRDMAIVRAKKENIPIILSSATPSLESFYNVRLGKFQLVTLSERHTRVALPKIEVVNMRGTRKWISDELRTAICETIKKKKQVLLFLNRRGYNPSTICHECGYKLQCINCSAGLVQHKMYEVFLCHYCGYKVKVQNKCPECNAENSLILYGVGVERIEEEVKALLPDIRVVVISSDVLTSVSNSKKLLETIKAGEVDVIIGTQVVTKGHHFPNLALVGVIDADASLYGGDLRAAERTYQMLQQVAGRAGREEEQGTVLFQTYNPQAILSKYLNSDFYTGELESRKQANMPPFTRISSIVVYNLKNNKAMLLSKNITKALTCNKIRILGPIPANTHRIKRRYIYKIIIISPKNFDIQSHLKTLANPRDVQIDVDSLI